MTYEECKAIIWEQTMLPIGFVWGTRENRVDREGFQRLIAAIRELPKLTEPGATVDRIIAACLFDSPVWVMNTAEHYSQQTQELGHEVMKMAYEMIEVTNEWLWDGNHTDGLETADDFERVSDENGTRWYGAINPLRDLVVTMVRVGPLGPRNLD